MSPMLLVALVAVPAFVLGCAIGYVANGSGAVWRRRFETERDYYAMFRSQSERARLADARRIAALEAAPTPTHAPAPEAATLADPALPLSRIRGIDAALAARLAALGVTRFDEIETLTGEDEMALELQLGLPAGRIARDQWRLQAMLLGSGDEAGQQRLLDAVTGRD